MVTFYHQQTEYFINVAVLIEQGSDGTKLGSRTVISPFKIFGMHSQDQIDLVSTYMSLRIFCIMWMFVNCIITWLVKKKSLNEKFSFQTFFDIYITVMLMICQAITTGITGNLLIGLEFSIEKLDEDTTKDVFWMTSKLAYEYKVMVFLDSFSVFLCAAILLTLSRNVSTQIDKVLNTSQMSVWLFIRIFLFFLGLSFGLTCFNMSIFGNTDQRYRNLLTAFIHSFYNIALLDLKDKVVNNLDQFIWIFINAIAYYWITAIFMIGISQAIVSSEYVFCEKGSEFPAVKEDGTWDKTVIDTDIVTKLKQGGRKLLFWSISWLP